MKIRVLALCMAILIVLCLSACSERQENTVETQEWPTVGMLQELPVPPSTKCIIEIETNERIMVKILSITEQDFHNYVTDCKNKGFTVDETYNSVIFDAYNVEGYEVNLIYHSADNELTVFLDAPIPMKQISWPSTDAGNQVPAPVSMLGVIDYSSEDNFRIRVGETDREAFANYVNECIKAGFTINVTEYDDHYSAENAKGYQLSLSYEGNNTMEIDLYLPEKNEDTTTNATDVELSTEQATEEIAEPETQTTDIEITEMIETTTEETVPTETEVQSLYYSTNDLETAKNGNSGVFAYRRSGSNYDLYWIIDFDEGYTYYFLDGNGDTSCDRIKIESGDLNDKVVIIYHDGSDTWQETLCFKSKRQPEHLLWKDYSGFSYDYNATDLSEAIVIRDTKTIKDY